MAVVNISFKIDGIDQEIKSVEDLNKVMGNLVQENEDVQKAQNKTSESGKKQAKQNDDTKDSFTKLQLQIRQTQTELQKAAAAGDKVKFKALRGQLDDLEESLEKTKFQSSQFDDQLASLPGPAGAAGNAMKGLDGVFKIFMANPILAVIAGIVGAFMLMKKALGSTAEGQATLNKISSAFSKIIGPILALVEKVALPIFNAFANVLEFVAEGFGDMVAALGISEKKIKEATFNIDEVQQKAAEKAKERAEKDKERAEKEKKTQEELAAKRKETSEKAIEAENKRRENAEAVADKLQELQDKQLTDTVEIARRTVLAQKEADLKMLKEKGATAQQIKQLNAAYAVLETQAVAKANEDKTKKSEEDAQKEKDRVKAQEEWLLGYKIQMTEKTYTDTKAITDAEEADALAKAKQRLDEKLSTEEEYLKAQDTIEEFYANKRKEQALANQVAKDALLDQYKIDRSETVFEAEDARIAAEEAKALAELEKLKGNEEERTKIEAFYDDLRLKNKKAAAERTLAVAAGAFGSISDLLGKETAAGKAAAIAQATINTYLAASQVMKDPTIVPTFLKPVLAGVQIALGLKQVKQIMSVEPPKAATGGMIVGNSHSAGGVAIEAEGGEFIINKYAMAQPGVAEMAMSLNSVARPKFADGGIVPSITELQSSVQSSLNVPIKTFVLSDDMTSSQEATAKINRLAKL
jgi:hypothetical protein